MGTRRLLASAGVKTELRWQVARSAAITDQVRN